MSWILATLVGVLLSVGINGQCTSEMTFVPLPNAATCVDGSAPGYFIDRVAASTEYVIWLADSDLCKDEADCLAQCGTGSECSGVDIATFDPSADILQTQDCYYNQFTCGSSNYASTQVIGESILCGDADTPFETYTRVYVPQCSRDWFLGNGAAAPASADLFNGALILDAVLDNITLSGATKVIWGGTRGGGIGALNQLSLIESKAPSATILGVFDSAWFVKIAEFGVSDFSDEDVVYSFNARLKEDTALWLNNSAINQNCSDDKPGDLKVDCLYARVLLTNYIAPEQPLFFSQSQYDLLLLAQNGLDDEDNADQFLDEVSFASNAIRFVEQYGSALRVAIEEANAADPAHYIFNPACAQYGALLTTNVEAVSRTSRQFGSAGELTFERSTDTWAQIEIAGLSLKDALVTWVESDGTVEPSTPDDTPGLFGDNIRSDRCGAFLCNEACPSDVVSFQLEFAFEEATRSIIVLVGVGVLGAGWAGFLWIFLRVRAFRLGLALYWRKHKKLPKEKLVLQAELDGMNFQSKPVSLSVRNLNYYIKKEVGVDVNKKAKFMDRFKKKRYKEFQILHNCSIAMRPGEFHALMGPSGSGKTTLLDILASTRDIGRMSGTHYINGVPSHLGRAKFLREWLRHNVGYVRQTDVLFPRLTVKEHLTHAAWLMLPQSMKRTAKLDRVVLVARLLEIADQMDVHIGDGGVSIEGGLSGGQRRRVSVATQLLKFPAALVLDEPTSGLDSSNALLLIQALKSIAVSAQINIIATIHQPRKEIFELLDQLTIIVAGRIAFSGTPAECSYFFDLNPNEVNIGDDILDKVKEYEKNNNLMRLFDQYQESDYARKVSTYIDEEETVMSKKQESKLKSMLKRNAKKEGRKSWNKAISTQATLHVLLSRTLRRGGFDVLRSGVISGIAGAIIGAVFIDSNTYTGKTALCYLMVSAATFISFTFLGNRYKSEKIMWEHERETGTEISWRALLVSQFVRNIVSGCIEAVCFGSAAYWVGGLNPDFTRFTTSLLLVVLTSVAVIAQNTMVDVALIKKGARSEDRLSILINMTLLCFGVLFNGFIIPLEELPIYYQWTSYILVTFWGFVGVLVNNFRDFDLPCDLSTLECATRTGNNQVVRANGYESFDVYFCIAMLVALTIVFKLISIVVFYFRYVRKRAELTRDTPPPQQKGEVMGRTMRVLMDHTQLNSSTMGINDGRVTETPNESLTTNHYFNKPAINNRNPFSPAPRTAGFTPPNTTSGGYTPNAANMEIDMDDV